MYTNVMYTTLQLKMQYYFLHDWCLVEQQDKHNQKSTLFSSGGKDIALGITKKVTVVVEITNEGENAFINKLEVIYPQSQVSPTKVQIENVSLKTYIVNIH